jgi:hypothetical protein
MIQYIVFLNLILVVLAAMLVFYQRQAYNVLVKQSANYTPAPTRVDVIEVKIPIPEVHDQYTLWKKAGYEVVRSKGASRGLLTLVMTKTVSERNQI